MKLSFCIPTYNRLPFLKKNLNLIIFQIISEKLKDKVYICISDNCSTDGTEQICKQLIQENTEIKITYKKCDKNYGPDRNFISAMNMSVSEYSILWGDDDFLHEGGLRQIFHMIDCGEKSGADIMISSTSIVDSKGHPLFTKHFLRKDIKEYVVDFSNAAEAKAFFFLLKDMGGMLSFISDVIYKTSIIHEIPFDERFLGTNYAFLCFWWGYLAKGNKLYYNSESFLDETYQYQAAYGFGVDRLLVDYNGYTVVADVALAGGKIDRTDFLQAFQVLHSLLKSRIVLISEKSRFNKMLLPKLKDCGVEDEELKVLYESISMSHICKNFLYKIIPESLVLFLKKIKRR